MTKAELIKELEGLPDDTEIKVPSSDGGNVWVNAIYFDYDWDGTEDYQAEAFISGDKNE